MGGIQRDYASCIAGRSLGGEPFNLLPLGRDRCRLSTIDILKRRYAFLHEFLSLNRFTACRRSIGLNLQRRSLSSLRLGNQPLLAKKVGLDSDPQRKT